MTTDKLEIGTEYLINLKALKEVAKICSAYGWKKIQEYDNVKSSLSVLGTDYGKPNASEIMTHISQGNRKMFADMEKIVNERIKVLEKEFDEL